ncbi:MAG: hypothetical protein ACYC2E_11605 [Sulfuricella sp.]
MCHALLQNPNFFRLLLRIDKELAGETRAAGCPCGGVLHRSDYPRKPRACLNEVRADFESRFSFCCSRCRKRTTAISVRFLGRRVYLSMAVVLVSARHMGQVHAAAGISATLGIPARTLQRWRHWWQQHFVLTPLWQAACARFMPPVVSDRLPGSLLERFDGTAAESLMRLLIFLTPLTVSRLITLQEGR